MSKVGAVLTLACDDELFALPVERVQEILDLRPITRLPNAPSQLLGMIDVRGNGVAVADLRALLGMAPAEDTEMSRIVVLWVQTDGRRTVVAFRADRVIEVTALDNDEIEHLPEGGLFNWRDRMISGIGRRSGELVTVLDMDRVFDGLTPELDAA
ncbi:chemotaxis protein CheW [Marivita sp. XM-24bin2]|jgi:purine-binding chemotaxis protein CheW|uniref:chemotaxis protein CheW n=1 Tax=unclassified Marivita TaxID=2632480 RepID=UPI000D79A349|nr:chemotaxis protein CheW [Marivita sp. XM-24bin2]MCR9108911.1 chemotaxis protein CheW [Paracoccaceae bacterium]PWL34967.1 MAG: chemotaxis protein CheW [Marivita sp. XM-24bin2]